MIMSEFIDVKEIFGENVFNDSVMRARLPKKVYQELKKKNGNLWFYQPGIRNNFINKKAFHSDVGRLLVLYY